MLIWCGAKGTWRCVDLPGFSQQIYQNLVKRKRQDSKTLKQRCEKSRITTPGARHQNTTCLAGPEMVASGVLDVGVLPDTLVQSTHPLYQTVSVRKQGHNLSIPPHVKELATSCLQLHSKIIQKCSIPSLHSCCFPLWSFWMLDAWCIDGFSFTAFLNKHFTSFYSPLSQDPMAQTFHTNQPGCDTLVCFQAFDSSASSLSAERNKLPDLFPAEHLWWQRRTQRTRTVAKTFSWIWNVRPQGHTKSQIKGFRSATLSHKWGMKHGRNDKTWWSIWMMKYRARWCLPAFRNIFPSQE